MIELYILKEIFEKKRLGGQKTMQSKASKECALGRSDEHTTLRMFVCRENPQEHRKACS